MQHTTLAAALLAALSANALANTQALLPPAEFTLDEIVVTATRIPTPLASTLAATSVITREAIQRSQASDMFSLLKSQPGIHVARSGGVGKATSVMIRGTGTKHVLVLVDGVRAASASTGEYDWSALSLDQIERIEIVRGPLSSIYGSDAVGGVIQIFTRRARSPSIKVEVGSQGGRAVSVSLGGGEAWHYSLEAGHESTNGLPTFVDDNTAFGFDRNHVVLGMDGRLNADLGLSARLNQSWGRNQQDAASGDNDYRNRSASLKLDHRIGPNWRQEFTLGNSLDSHTSYSPYIPSRIETHRDSLSWQHDLTLQSGQAILGVDYWNDHVTKDNSGLIDQRVENLGLFGQYRFAVLNGDAQLGLRRDRHDAFGGHNTWNVRWGRELAPGLRFSAGYGTAFKAPTVNELFWPYSVDGPYDWPLGAPLYSDTFITHGNTALKPETSRTSELGLDYRRSGWNTGLRLYETQIRDLIEWKETVTPSGTGSGGIILTTYGYQPANISSARIRGLELNAQMRWLGLDWQAGYTRLLATSLVTGQQLDRRPKNSLTLGASRHINNHSLKIEGSAYSQRLDINGTVPLAGYGLVHAAYEYAINKDTSLGLRLENMFDHEYALARSRTRFYSTPGRSVFLSLRWQPAK